MKRIFLSALLLCLMSLSGIAQDFDKARLDNYFDLLEKNDKFMGSVAVSKNGTLIYRRSVGFADLENGIKANENSGYRIGSISKTFTTVMVMKAVESRKLKLTTTIDKYFPEIENSAEITIEHLLRHRSGIHSFTDDEDYMNWNTQPKTEAELLEIIRKGGSDFKPDSRAAYSNSNFLLLSFILEKIYGKSYAELLETQIIRPLGMRNTSYGKKINTADNKCKSYNLDAEQGWKLASETDLSIPLGAGGIVSTPADLTRFSDALFGGKLLKKKSLQQMKTIKGNFGMGLFPIPFYERSGYGHTGGIDGFSSVFAHFDDGNISYALTSNGTKINNNSISIAVLSAVYNKPFELPSFSGYQVAPEDLEKYTGSYSSKDIPLKITVTRDKNQLIAQGSGQPSFSLEPADKDVFQFDQAGVVMEFNPENRTMTLKQSGMQFLFTRDE